MFQPSTPSKMPKGNKGLINHISNNVKPVDYLGIQQANATDNDSISSHTIFKDDFPPTTLSSMMTLRQQIHTHKILIKKSSQPQTLSYQMCYTNPPSYQLKKTSLSWIGVLRSINFNIIYHRPLKIWSHEVMNTLHSSTT